MRPTAFQLAPEQTTAINAIAELRGVKPPEALASIVTEAARAELGTPLPGWAANLDEDGLVDLFADARFNDEPAFALKLTKSQAGKLAGVLRLCATKGVPTGTGATIAGKIEIGRRGTSVIITVADMNVRRSVSWSNARTLATMLEEAAG